MKPTSKRPASPAWRHDRADGWVDGELSKFGEFSARLSGRPTRRYFRGEGAEGASPNLETPFRTVNDGRRGVTPSTVPVGGKPANAGTGRRSGRSRNSCFGRSPRWIDSGHVRREGTGLRLCHVDQFGGVAFETRPFDAGAVGSIDPGFWRQARHSLSASRAQPSIALKLQLLVEMWHIEHCRQSLLRNSIGLSSARSAQGLQAAKVHGGDGALTVRKPAHRCSRPARLRPRSATFKIASLWLPQRSPR